jgi:beta-galactosidase
MVEAPFYGRTPFFDAEGLAVPTAANLIHFDLRGPGRILGVGNGDPSSHEPDKASERKVFNGLAQVIVQSSRQPGTIRLTATAPGLRAAVAEIRSEPSGLIATGP